MNLSTAWLFAAAQAASASPPARRNTSIGGLSFALEIDGQHVAMRISEDALRHCFGAQACCSTWLAAYRRHARTIDACALARHLRDPRQPVCLQRGDFPGLPTPSPQARH